MVYTIAPSPLLAPDGLDRHRRRPDSGHDQRRRRSWQNVTPPALTAWSRVTTVEASHFDFERGVRQRGSPSAAGLRAVHLSHARHGQDVAEDHEGPARRRLRARREGRSDAARLLFAGTERGVFVSFDDGDNWQPLQLNLPVTSVRDFEIYNGDLIVATHGRGFWVIDDISPLRQIDRCGAAVGRLPVQAGRRDQRHRRAATTERRCRRTSRRRPIRRTARRSTTT